MITETQRKLLNRMIEAVERDALEGERGISIEEGQRAKKAKEKAIRGVEAEFQAAVEQIQENRRLLAKIDWYEAEVRRLKAELRERK